VAKTTRMATANLPLGTHAADVRRRIEMMEHLLERSIPIPGFKSKVGLDAVLGLVPVGGDVIAALLGLYIVWEARNLKMPATTMARMLGNVGFDWLIGLVPVVGDAADFVFKSNSRNLKLIKRHLDKHHPGTSTVNQR
jgi:hypothetical protein